MASKTTDLEKQVQCAICLERYKEPKVLSCLHTYCKTCLQKLLTQSGRMQHKIACPECRQVTQVPRGDVGQLQGNFWVNNLMSFLTVTSDTEAQKLICENCDSGDAAISRCSDCGVFLCDFCVKVHKRMHNLKHHQILTLDQVKSGSAKALVQPMRCEKHKDEMLKLFCQTCDKLICRDCTIVDHQRHSYVFVEDVVSKEREKVRKTLLKTKAKVPDLMKGVKSVEEMEKKVKAKENKVAQEIDALKVKQFKAMEEMFNKMHADLKALSQTKLKKLKSQREDLMLAMARVKRSVEFTECTLRDGSDVELLSMKKQLVTNLSMLNKSRWGCEPCEGDTMNLMVHHDVKQVASGIATVEDEQAARAKWASQKQMAYYGMYEEDW